MSYFWLKAFHVIGVVSWMAGLFYLPRLFVYHAEALTKQEPDRSVLSVQFKVMELRLYRGITTPAMIFTLATALGLLVEEPGALQMPWLQAKIGLVFVLIVYHLFCGQVVGLFASDRCRWSGSFFRIFNEIPTVLLVAIVLLVIFKGALPGGTLLTVLGALTLLLGLGILVYARVRRA